MSTIASSCVIFGSAADAIAIVKDHNTNALNLGAARVGGIAPTAAEVAVWNNTVTAANTARQGHHHPQFPRPPVLL